MSDKKETNLPNISEGCSSNLDENYEKNVSQSETGLVYQEPEYNNDEVKKAAAASLIGKYYTQLRNGCGDKYCTNPNCASSGKLDSLSNDEAAVKALQLFTEHATICDNKNKKSVLNEPLHNSTSVIDGPYNRQRKLVIKNDLEIWDETDDDEMITLQENPTPTSPTNMSFVNESSEDSPEASISQEYTTPTSSKNKSVINKISKESSETSLSQDQAIPTSSKSVSKKISKDSSSSSLGFSSNSNTGLTEECLENTIKECVNLGTYANLRILLRTIFSNESALKCSFLISECSKCSKTSDIGKSNCIDKSSINDGNKGCTKEELRAAEMDLDKDIDCQEDTNMMDVDQGNSSQASVVSEKCTFSEGSSSKKILDLECLRRSYETLFKVPESEFISTLMDAIRQLLKDSLAIQLKVFPKIFQSDMTLVNIFIILLENPCLTSTDFTEEVLGDFCKVMAHTGIDQQVALVKHIAQWETSKMHHFLQCLHQLITIQLLPNEFSLQYTINDEDTITSATRVMKIIYYASISRGELDYPLFIDLPPQNPLPSQESFSRTSLLGSGNPPQWDPLGKALGLHPLDGREPAIPFEEFYDDFLSDQLEVDRDFAYFKTGVTDQFSFLSHPFILTPATKVLGLYYDNRIRMYSERRQSIYQTVLAGTPANPYLNLHIRRDHIIEDALIELEMVALENPSDLKKQLVVEFEGEQGIDEGGVSKEFFQLIVELIFNPDYAMFCLNKETETFWFNPTSFESDAQFTLVGVILGLAIYNNVILDVHFPPVMYKKLCGKPGSFHDLKEWNTTLHQSLLDLLNYEGDDMAETFYQTFRVGYQDIFGTSLHHDLKPDGDNIFVTQDNKKEFVQMYADFLLNKSVETQFAAFKKGFVMVTGDSPLQHLFRPHELELLVCGSQHYDFLELRKSTEYEGGYTSSSPIITWFWDLVDEMSPEEKKQLLQFTTGSARVPVGGLARLKLVIARHGPDSERLPTAHTCFNVLLLPDYSSKEKLNERLLKAIKYAQGFGML